MCTVETLQEINDIAKLIFNLQTSYLTSVGNKYVAELAFIPTPEKKKLDNKTIITNTDYSKIEGAFRKTLNLIINGSSECLSSCTSFLNFIKDIVLQYDDSFDKRNLDINTEDIYNNAIAKMDSNNLYKLKEAAISCKNAIYQN